MATSTSNRPWLVSRCHTWPRREVVGPMVAPCTRADVFTVHRPDPTASNMYDAATNHESTMT
jgi:hypothetical protein